MGRFGLAIVAIDAYEHHDDLPSTETAGRIERLLEPYGVAAVTRPAATDEADHLVRFLHDWATDADGPGPTLLYWVGHGSREGPYAWLLAGRSRSPLTQHRAVNARDVADMLRVRWVERAAGDGSWTVLVLDCCRGRDAATAIVNTLTEDPGSRPGQLAVVEVGGSSATEVGRFADALEEALAGFTENDTVIPLRSLLFAATDRLGVNVQPTIWLSRDAALANPRAAPAVLMATQDLVEEWRATITDLEPDVRDHFLAKAQGTELGELGWHFAGRAEECARLVDWLRETPSGMLVVTGEPGAGKSALLGRFVALADPTVADVLDRAGLTADDPAARPERGAFDGVVHLAGRTLHDTRAAIEQAVPGLAISEAVVSLDDDRRTTLLVDALDEAQAPKAIAYDVLRPLARHPNVRLVVGTRRSLEEGPDQPAAPRPELLDALAVSEADALVLRREPAAMADYARRRLAADAPDLDPDLTTRIIERVAAVDQPFLFVRLALHELLARVDELDQDLVDAVLSGGHGDVFARAVDRLTRQRPTTARLLRSLAYAQGRGLPRHDGVWAAVAHALFPDGAVGERDVAQALVDAAPYIVLDGEHGESVHRLAHRTFAERFLAEDPDLDASHAAITDELLAAVAEVGWPQAGAYLLAHLPRHAARSPARLEQVCVDPAWLKAALDRFGIDELLSILDAASPAGRAPALARVEGAVRRARVALARDPHQLASQLHARLRDEDDPAIRSLVDRLPSIAPDVWLRVTEGGATWTASVHATMTFDARIRALATGRLDSRHVILVGAGDTVACWDPDTGTSERLLDTAGERVTALALATLDGRDLVAVGAGYDRTVTVYPAEGGQPLLRRTEVDCRQLAVGAVGGLPVVVVCEHGGARACTFDGQVMPVLGDADVLAAGFEGDTIVVLVDVAGELRVRRIGFRGLTAAARGRGTVLSGAAAGVAHALVNLDDALVAVVAQRDAVAAWHAVSGQHLGEVAADPGFVVRTATASVVHGSLVLAAGNDTDYKGGYVTIRSPGETETTSAVNPLLGGAVAVSPSASLALALEDGRPVLFDPRTPDASGIASGTPDELAEVFGPAAPTRSPGGGLRLGPAEPLERPEHLSVERPADWPVDARAFGLFDDRHVVATAHVDGVCWLWSAETGEVVAGPFGARRGEVWFPHHVVKGGPQPSTDVAYRQGPSGAILARVHDGAVAAWDVRTGAHLAVTDIPGSEASAVALGVVDQHLVLARGAAGGAISLWSLDDERRLCGLTLDSRIRRLWFDHAEPTLIALTADGALHVADVVT